VQAAAVAQQPVAHDGERVVVGSGGVVLAVVGFTIAHGRISAIDLITDRSKLRRVSGR
jgi:hypothetical protein